MLTAKKARELANDFEKRKQAKEYVGDHILPQIEKEALKGNTELFFETCQPRLEDFVISELENLGYYVKKSEGSIFNLRASYIIKW